MNASLSRARLASGALAATVLGVMLYAGQVHVAPAVPDRWMPQADGLGYSVLELETFVRAVDVSGLEPLYTLMNRWFDGVFALSFGLWTALLLWPDRRTALGLGLAYAATDLAENAVILAGFETGSALRAVGPFALASYLTTLKFLLLAGIAIAIVRARWRR